MRPCDSAYDRGCTQSEVYPGQPLTGGHYLVLDGGGVWVWGPDTTHDEALEDVTGLHTLRLVGDWPEDVESLLENMGASELDSHRAGAIPGKQ